MHSYLVFIGSIHICIYCEQFENCDLSCTVYHWCEVKTRLWVLGLGRSGEIPKLNETMAIEIGANMIGEGKCPSPSVPMHVQLIRSVRLRTSCFWA